MSWSQIISISVVPVVIISACGLLCLAFYNRLAMVVSRLRSLQRERLELFRELSSHPQKLAPAHAKEGKKTLKILAEQTEVVLHRARMLRSGLLCFLGAIAALIITSLLLGLGTVVLVFGHAVIFFFVFGLLLMLYGISFMFREMLESLKPIERESLYVTEHLQEHSFDSGE